MRAFDPTLPGINELRRSTTDHEWNGTVQLLMWPGVARDTLRHVDVDGRSIDWKAIAGRAGWSSTERIMLDAAYAFWTGRDESLWGGPTRATVAALARSLNSEQLSWLEESLKERRGRR